MHMHPLHIIRPLPKSSKRIRGAEGLEEYTVVVAKQLSSQHYHFSQPTLIPQYTFVNMGHTLILYRGLGTIVSGGM